MTPNKLVSAFALLALVSCSHFDKYENHSEEAAHQVDIQKAIDALPTGGGTVRIPAGTYVLNKGLHIKRSNVALIGETGARLVLADNVCQPLILVGDDKEIPEYQINNIYISNLELDGNMKNQPTETDPAREWIRNNNIDVRMVHNLRIDNINSHSARSGAFVVSWGSCGIFVRSSLFHNNYFDGIALYASKDMFFSDFACYDNQYAGISIDNDVKDTLFVNGVVKDNSDVGIFVRDAADIIFNGLIVKNNQKGGVFLSHCGEKGISRLLFTSSSFVDNHNWAFYLASTSEFSSGNVINSSLFYDDGAGIKSDDQSIFFQKANVFIPDNKTLKQK